MQDGIGEAPQGQVNRQGFGAHGHQAQTEDVMDKIRRRAHDLWEAEGRPPDRDLDLWLRAEAEVVDEIALR